MLKGIRLPPKIVYFTRDWRQWNLLALCWFLRESLLLTSLLKPFLRHFGGRKRQLFWQIVVAKDDFKPKQTRSLVGYLCWLAFSPCRHSFQRLASAICQLPSAASRKDDAIIIDTRVTVDVRAKVANVLYLGGFD